LAPYLSAKKIFFAVKVKELKKREQLGHPSGDTEVLACHDKETDSLHTLRQMRGAMCQQQS
jgi:hypothetical protein